MSKQKYIAGEWFESMSDIKPMFRALSEPKDSLDQAIKWISDHLEPGDYDIVIQMPGKFTNARQLDFEEDLDKAY